MSEVPPTSERKEKQYTPEDISNLVFWSFHASQGAPMIQTSAFIMLLMQNPSLVPAVEKLKEDLGDDPDVWESNPLVRNLVDKIFNFRNSRLHTSRNDRIPREKASKQVRDELSSLFSGLESSARYAASPEAEPMWGFINSVITNEVRLHGVAELEKERVGLPEARRRIGGSMLCWYGLSPKREEHLAGATGSPAQPPELQELWRKAGDFVRTHYPEMRDKRGELHLLVERYEKETGEVIALPE